MLCTRHSLQITSDPFKFICEKPIFYLHDSRHSVTDGYKRRKRVEREREEPCNRVKQISMKMRRDQISVWHVGVMILVVLMHLEAERMNVSMSPWCTWNIYNFSTTEQMRLHGCTTWKNITPNQKNVDLFFLRIPFRWEGGALISLTVSISFT